MKIRPVGAELFHADGRTDMTKIIAAFSSFVNAPKMLGRVILVFHCEVDEIWALLQNYAA